MNARAGCVGAAGWRSRPNSRLGPRHRLPRVFPLGVVMFPISLQPVQVMHNNSRALGVAPGHSPPCSPLTFSRNPAVFPHLDLRRDDNIVVSGYTLSRECMRSHAPPGHQGVQGVASLAGLTRNESERTRSGHRRQVPRPRGFHVIRRIRTGSTRIHNHTSN